MTLRVKQGREYVLGGKVYRGGDVVDGVPAKFVAVLTGSKGPLERAEVTTKSVDLPKAVLSPIRPPLPEGEPVPFEPAPTYLRRDMTAGQTGEAKPSFSSRRGRQPKEQTSEESGEGQES